MRLLVHRGQALLLLVVGGLAGAVVAGAVMERNGQQPPVATRAAEFMAPSRSHLPARIQIGRPSSPPPDGAVVAARQTDPPSAIVAEPPPPSPTTPAVPATAYAYPPRDRGPRGPPC